MRRARCSRRSRRSPPLLSTLTVVALGMGVFGVIPAAAQSSRPPAQSAPPAVPKRAEMIPESHDAHMEHVEHMDHAAMRTATPAERAELARQIDAVRRATERYRDIENAKKDGYAPFGKEAPLMGEHWYHKGVREPPEGTPLDLEHPGTLQYAVIDGKRVLVGVAFSTRLRRTDSLPEGFAGPDDHWHQHDLIKAVSAATEDRSVLRWISNRWMDGARKKGDDRMMLTMVHAWVWLDNPDGVFAMHHRVIPYLKSGLPASFADGASEEAARGLDLATDNGCARALDGELWMAHASREQSRTLREACAQSAHRLQGLLEGHPPAAILNEEAESVWRSLDEARHRTYTPHQLERIGSVTEMMM